MSLLKFHFFSAEFIFSNMTWFMIRYSKLLFNLFDNLEIIIKYEYEFNLIIIPRGGKSFNIDLSYN